MTEPIFIKNLLGIEATLAQKCDKDGNGILECTDSFDEISLFNAEKAKFYKTSENSIFQETVPQDATRVEPSPEVKLIKIEEAAAKEVAATETVLNPQVIAKTYEQKSGVTKKPDLVYDTEAMKEALDSLLNRNSIMKGTAEAFINSAQKDTFSRKLDPIVLMAIAMCESGKGTDKRAKQQKNIGGIMKNGSLRRFNKIEECIDIIANTINRRLTEGYQSIKSIANSGRYCAKSAAPKWAKDVSFFAEQIRQKYNELLTKKYSQ